MAQEDDTAGRHDPAILVSIVAELDKLVVGLAHDRLVGDRLVEEISTGKRDVPLGAEARLVASRRELGSDALTRVVSFLLSPAVFARWPEVVQLGLHHHLDDVRSALSELGAGQNSDLFILPAGRPRRVASPRDEEFRGRVAAIAALLRKQGIPSGEADKRTAAGLNQAGYGTARGGKSERGAAAITGATVNAWLKKAREAANGSVLKEAFEGRLALAEHRKTLGFGYGSTAEAMMKVLAMDRPGSRLKKLPLAGAPAPEK